MMGEKANELGKALAKHFDARHKVRFVEHGTILQFYYFELSPAKVAEEKTIEDAGKWVEAFGCQVPTQMLENLPLERIILELTPKLELRRTEFMNNKAQLRFK